MIEQEAMKFAIKAKETLEKMDGSFGQQDEICFLKLAIQWGKNEQRRLELIEQVKKLIDDSIGTGSPRIREWQSALYALEQCEVKVNKIKRYTISTTYDLHFNSEVVGIREDKDGIWVKYTPEIGQTLKNEQKRLELVEQVKKLIDDSIGIGSPRIREWQSALYALEECEVKDDIY